MQVSACLCCWPAAYLPGPERVLPPAQLGVVVQGDVQADDHLLFFWMGLLLLDRGSVTRMLFGVCGYGWLHGFSRSVATMCVWCCCHWMHQSVGWSVGRSWHVCVRTYVQGSTDRSRHQTHRRGAINV